MNFGDAKILGISADVIFALIFLLILIILGIVTFHFYGYVSAGHDAALKAGVGVGGALFPQRQQQQQVITIPRQ